MDYESMPWLDLMKLRYAYANDPQMQAVLAPYEHRAYYREMAQDNPYKAMAMSVIEPAYQGVKALGILPSNEMTTPASLNQITESLKGIREGLFSGL